MGGGMNGLTAWRIEKASITLNGARKTLELGEYGFCLNRCYYAVFYAMQAANSLCRFDSRKHSGVISFFRHTFIKSGFLDAKLSKIISDTSQYRERADYEDLYEPTKEAAEEQLKNAEVFVSAVSTFLKEKVENTEEGDRMLSDPSTKRFQSVEGLFEELETE